MTIGKILFFTEVLLFLLSLSCYLLAGLFRSYLQIESYSKKRIIIFSILGNVFGIIFSIFLIIFPIYWLSPITMIIVGFATMEVHYTKFSHSNPSVVLEAMYMATFYAALMLAIAETDIPHSQFTQILNIPITALS